MADACTHLGQIRDVTPSALGCEDCLRTGDAWFHLRICRTCGHVGCCDQSPNKHATKHFHATRHPIIEGYDPPEGWGGAMSTSCSLIWQTGQHRTTGQSRATIERPILPSPTS